MSSNILQLKIGTKLQGGKFKIINVLGQGGFGITYLAEDCDNGNVVAIKEFFPKEFCGRNDANCLIVNVISNTEIVSKLKRRFQKEVQNIAKLNHRGIVKIHGVFEENNTAYYIMDYVKGENLNEMVKRRGPLPENIAIKYIGKVCLALEYIHSRNMTHFDVKPANIVICKSDNYPILIDFGLSKQYDNNGEATSTLLQCVSQGYSPVELYESTVNGFSPQVDIYSLGATLYYLVTGTVPPTVSQYLKEGLQFSKIISENTISVIKRSMNVNYTRRYKSVRYFLRSLLIDKNSEAKTMDVPVLVKEGSPQEDTKVIQDVGLDPIEEFPYPYIEYFHSHVDGECYVGEKVRLDWSVKYADEIYINDKRLSAKKTSYMYQIDSPMQSVTLVVKNRKGYASAMLQIPSKYLEQPIIHCFDCSSAKELFVGSEVSVYWQIKGADRIEINGEPVPKSPRKKMIKLIKVGINTITLDAYNSRGKSTKTITVYANTMNPNIMNPNTVYVSKGEQDYSINYKNSELGGVIYWLIVITVFVLAYCIVKYIF